MVKRLVRIVVALCLCTGMAQADFTYQCGTFSLGAGGNGDTVVVSLSITPKFMIFSHAYARTTSTASGSNNLDGDFGFSDGTNDIVLSVNVDGSASQSHKGFHSFRQYALSVFTNCEIEVLSFGTNVCSLYVPDNVAENILVAYWAWGGSDITNVKVGYDSLKASTGSQSYSGPGFRPDIVFFGLPQARTSFGSTPNGDFVSLGAASGASEEGCVLTYGRYNSSPTEAGRWASSANCMAYVDTVGGAAGDTLSIQVDFTQFETTGYTLNHTRAMATRDWYMYAAIKGGAWKVGSETAKSTTGTKATTGVGFTPSSLFMFSNGDTTMTGDSIAGSPRFVLGGSDGTNEVSTGWNYQDGAENRDTITTWIINTKALSIYKKRPTGSPVLGAEADWNAFGADGFTLDWTTADSARQFIYIVSGTAPPPETPLKIGPNGITIGVE